MTGACMDIATKAAYRLIGKRVRKNKNKYHNLQIRIRQANISIPVDQYVSTAYFYSFISATFSFIIGLLAGNYIFGAVAASNPDLTRLPLWIQDHFIGSMTFFSGMALMIMMGYLTYFGYTKIPHIKADARKADIDQSLPHSVAYLYALSRGGGMNLFDIFKSLGRHAHIYGASAEEFGYIVKDMEYFGYDLLSAMENAFKKSPSENFKEFIQGLISTVTSGGDTTTYLKSKTDQYHYGATREQKLFLETLGMLAEAYISVFVVGPLLLMILLFVLGFMGFDAVDFLYILIYLLIPGTTLIYIVILCMVIGNSERPPNLYELEKELNAFDDVKIKTESEEDSKLIKRIYYYKKLSEITNSITHPIKTMQERPSTAFFASIPLAMAYLLNTTYDHIDKIARIQSLNFHAGRINVGIATAVDEHIFYILLIIFLPFILFYEIRNNRIKQIEEQIPEFLKRLANINEAGILLVDAITMTTQSKIGVLHSEVKRMVQDIAWGASMSEALRKFEHRISTNTTSRVITLLIKASESTSDVRSVLSIAARNSELQKNLKKERAAEMNIYVFIIYLAYLVYLFITVLLTAYFLPAMPESAVDAVPGMPFSMGFDEVEYKMLFFHTSMIQGFCSGLVAGKMGAGNINSGLKHSFAMMLITYAVFTYII